MLFFILVSLKPVKHKTVLCLFGIINRSIKHTWANTNELIVKELENNGCDVDIYVFDLIPDNSLVDGLKLEMDDYKIIPFTHYESKLQSELDIEIDEQMEGRNATFGQYNEKTQIKNCYRQMYSEYRVGLFLDSKNYDSAVVCGPDYYLHKPINVEDLCNSKEEVYVADVYNRYNRKIGYSNGYYFSRNMDALKCMLCRYKYIVPYMIGFKKDYENLLKLFCDKNRIKVKVSDQIFFKIRANNKIWKGPIAGGGDKRIRGMVKNFIATNPTFRVG